MMSETLGGFSQLLLPEYQSIEWSLPQSQQSINTQSVPIWPWEDHILDHFTADFFDVVDMSDQFSANKNVMHLILKTQELWFLVQEACVAQARECDYELLMIDHAISAILSDRSKDPALFIVLKIQECIERLQGFNPMVFHSPDQQDWKRLLNVFGFTLDDIINIRKQGLVVILFI